jgi:predicted metal-dependent phosphoesterase TrpH
LHFAIPKTLSKGDIPMANGKIAKAKQPNAVMAKLQDFGKHVGDKAAAAGTAAKAHVARNKAAYIAGGAGLAAGAAGMAALNRKKQQSHD